MRNKGLKISLLLFISIFFLASNLYAGNKKSGFYWWRDPEITEEIGLTKEQVDNIENIFHIHIDKISEVDKKIVEKENDLKKLLEDPASENNEVKEAGKEVLKLKSEKKAYKLDMLFGIRDVLTVEQRKALKDIKNKHK